MNQRTLAIFSVSAIMILCMAAPVSAFYFEFFYFETDKLVYEVGETIDMVAKLIADFSQDGWCHVSFAVVTDQGPVFADSYSISSSPDIRYPNSSYIIQPDDTSPGIDGIIAYVIFNVEIYDGYSQGGGDTIEINITRGSLHVVPQSSTSIEFGTNETLELKVKSIHNNNVVYSSSPVTISIYNESSSEIFSGNATTNANGSIFIDCDSSFGLPGAYDIEISSNGTEDFLPLFQSVPIAILPASSNLSILSAPTSVICETPNGIYAESVDIAVQHTGTDNMPLNDSIIQWITVFSSGTMDNLGNGLYSISIPFHIAPGNQLINLTATNPLYQTEFATISISVIPRNAALEVNAPQDHTITTPLVFNVTMTDLITGSEIESYPLSIDLVIASTTIDSITGITNAFGQLFVSFNIPQESWGSGSLIITSQGTSHFMPSNHSIGIDFHFSSQISHQILQPAVLDYSAEISVTLKNPLELPVIGADIHILNETGYILAAGTTNSQGSTHLIWLVSPNTEIRLHNYTLHILAHTLTYLAESTSAIQIQVQYPLVFLPDNSTWNANRNSDVTIRFILDSEWTFNQSINVSLNDSTGQFSQSAYILTDTNASITLSIESGVALGRHIVLVILETLEYTILGPSEFEIIVTGSIDGAATLSTIYYSENYSLYLNLLYDNNEAVQFVDIHILIDSQLISALENCNTSSEISLVLPSWILPGEHEFRFEISADWCTSLNSSVLATVWMRTEIVLIIGEQEPQQILAAETTTIEPSTSQPNIRFNNSLGSIMAPPPIFVKELTSTLPSTALDTSPDNCPRLSSGTSKRSTDCAKTCTASSGNGQTVLSLKDLIADWLRFFVINSSTALEVHPYEIIPQSASSGPVIT